MTTSGEVPTDWYLAEIRANAAVNVMHLASRAEALIGGGLFDLADAIIAQIPDDAIDKARLQASIAMQRKSSLPSGLEQISDLGKDVGERDEWREDASQAHAARRASAAGEYVLARNYAGYIKNTELRQMVEAEIAEVESAAGKDQNLPAGQAEFDNDSELPGGRSNAT